MEKLHVEHEITRKRHEMSMAAAAPKTTPGTLARLAGELFELREQLRLISGALMLRQAPPSEAILSTPTWYVPGYGFIRS